MKYFILLLILLSGISYATESKYATEAKCVDEQRRYWWGDKFEEVDAQVIKLTEDLQYAVLNNDYKEIKKYIKFPIKFYVQYYIKSNTEYSAKKSKYRIWTALNIGEFAKYFNIINSKKCLSEKFYSSTQFIRIQDPYARYENHNTVLLEAVCSDFHSTPKNEYLRLPHDLGLCSKVRLRILSINGNLFN